MVSDAQNEVARLFGIVFRLPQDLAQIYKSLNMDLEKFNGDASWELPMPARYVIDSDGVIRSAVVNFDYTYRPEPSDTLRILEELTASG